MDEINSGNWKKKTLKEIDDKIEALESEISNAKIFEIGKKSRLRDKVLELSWYADEKSRSINNSIQWFNDQISIADMALKNIREGIEGQKISIRNSTDKENLIKSINEEWDDSKSALEYIKNFNDPLKLNNEREIQEKLAEFKAKEDEFNQLVAEVEKIPVPQEDENEGSADEPETGVSAENSAPENNPEEKSAENPTPEDNSEEENTENPTPEDNPKRERAEDIEPTTNEDAPKKVVEAVEDKTETPTENNIPQPEIDNAKPEVTEETEKDTSEPKVENTDFEQKEAEQNSTTGDLAENSDETQNKGKSKIRVEAGILPDEISKVINKFRVWRKNRWKGDESKPETQVGDGETLDKDSTPVDEAGEDGSERQVADNSMEGLNTPKGEPIDMDKLFREIEGGEKETETAADGGRPETRMTVYEPQETRVTTTEKPETGVTTTEKPETGMTEYKQPETEMTVFGDSSTEIANSENDEEFETIILDKEKPQGLPKGKKEDIFDVEFEEVRQDKNEETRKELEKPRKLTADEKNEIRQMMFEVKCTILEAGDVWVDSYSKSSIETNIARAKTILEGKMLRTTNKKDLKYLSEDIQRLDQLKEEITEKFFTAENENSETEEVVEESVTEDDSAENGDETSTRKMHQIRDKVRDVADKVGGVFDKFKGLKFKRREKDKNKCGAENGDESLEETLEGENPYATAGATSTTETPTAGTSGATPEEEIPTTGTTGTPPTAETPEGENPYATAGATSTAETTGATTEAETPEPVVMGGIPEGETQEGENPYETTDETSTDTSGSGADNRRRERFVAEDEPWVEKPKKMGLLRRLWRFLTTPIRSIKDLIMNRHAQRVMDFERLDDETLERELQNAERRASEREAAYSSRREERSFDRHPEGEERETVGRERESVERGTESLEADGSVTGNSREEETKKHKKRKFKLEQIEVDENGVAHLEDSKVLDKLVKKNGKTTKRYNVLKQVISKYPSTLRSLPPKVLEELSNANVNGVNALDDLKGTYIMAWINKVGAGKMNTNALIDEIEKFMNENRERAGETPSPERGSRVGVQENEAS